MFGYDSERRADPTDVLDGWLRALGIGAKAIPPDSQGRELLYRSELERRTRAGTPVLVIVDNASSAGQVAPLMPADNGSALLVTSRHRLDLGIRVHRLSPLELSDAEQILRRCLDQARGTVDERPAAEPSAVERLARLCGCLPLALRIVASLLTDVPTLRLDQWADDLESERLDGLERDESAVRAAFELSYRHLRGSQGCLFRDLALAPGPDVSTESASVLIATGETAARRFLTELVRMSLLEPLGGDRWRLHDLLRVYAGEMAKSAPHSAQGREDLVRLLTYLRHTADVADDLLVGRPRPDTPRFSDVREAVGWLEAEHQVLVAAVSRAREIGEADHAINLPMILADFLRSRRQHTQWAQIAEIAYQAAEEVGNQGDLAKLAQLMVANAQRVGDLGQGLRMARRAYQRAHEAQDWRAVAGVTDVTALILRKQGHVEEALYDHDEAARMFERVGDGVGAAKARVNAANALRVLGRYEEALTRFRAVADFHMVRRDQRAFARTSLNMGALYAELERFFEAAAHLTMVRDFSRDGVEPGVLGGACLLLGTVFGRVGQPQESEEAFEEALETFRALGDAHNMGQVWLRRRDLLRRAGRLEEAAEAKRRADAISGEGG